MEIMTLLLTNINGYFLHRYSGTVHLLTQLWILYKSETDGHARIQGICGSGHLDYRFGIPERISPEVSTYVLTWHAQDHAVEHDVADCVYLYIS